MILLLALITFTNASLTICKNAYCESCEASGGAYNGQGGKGSKQAVEANGECTSCIENYILIDKQCVFKREVGCEEFGYDLNGKYYCSKCANGYKLNLKSHLCEKGTEGCADKTVSIEQAKCQNCKNGYVNGVSGCIKCDNNPHCVQLQAGSDDCSKCVKCKQGTMLNSLTGECIVRNEYCKAFKNEQSIQCDICKLGYYPDVFGICRRGQITGCLDYIDDATCYECANGGYVSGGKCVSGCNADHCVKCYGADKNQCLQCQPGYSLSFDGKCEKCEANNCDYCGDYYPSKTCLTCTEGYFLMKNGQCKQCDNTCKVCATHGCIECAGGYYKDANGTCTSCGDKCALCRNTGCAECEDGYHLSGGKCVYDGDHCTYYNSYMKRCGQCEKGYRWDGQACSACTDRNCAYCDKDANVCTQCKPGAYFNGEGNCIACKESNVGTCNETHSLTCLEGYYFDENHACQKCDAKCRWCEGKADYCTLCNDTSKTAVIGECREPDPYCFEYNDKGHCSQCYYSYLPNDKGVCVHEPCKGMLDNDNCGICNVGYYMTTQYKCDTCSDKCVDGCSHTKDQCNTLSLVENCLTYNEQNECIECRTGFILAEDKLTCNADLSFKTCQETFTGKCSVCQYKQTDDNGNDIIIYRYPDSDGTCPEKPSNKPADFINGANALSILVVLLMVLLL